LTVSDWYHDQMPGLLDFFISKINPTGAEPVPKSALLNETQNLTISVQPGKTYLFRMINIGAFAGQYVWFEGHNITIVEVDGIYTHPAEASMIYLSAAQRCSFLLTARNSTSENFPIVASMDTVGLLPSNQLSSRQLTNPDLVRSTTRGPQLQRDRMAGIRLEGTSSRTSCLVRGFRPL